MNKHKDSNGEWIRRKDIRLDERDYSENGIYFVTVCVKDKHRILWEEHSCKFDSFTTPKTPVFYSEIGAAVKRAIIKIPEIYPTVTVDEFSIMPDHLHLLLIINRNNCDQPKKHGRAMLAPTISEIIRQMKGAVTKDIGYSIWQKSFYDRIVRSRKEYLAYIEYIRNNPFEYRKKYFSDKENLLNAFPKM